MVFDTFFTVTVMNTVFLGTWAIRS